MNGGRDPLPPATATRPTQGDRADSRLSAALGGQCGRRAGRGRTRRNRPADRPRMAVRKQKRIPEGNKLLTRDEAEPISVVI